MSDPHFNHRSLFPFAAVSAAELAQERRDREKRLLIAAANVPPAQRKEFERLALEGVERMRIKTLFDKLTNGTVN